MEQFFISVLEQHIHIFHLCWRLLTNFAEDTFYVTEKWEVEMNAIIEDKIQEDLCAGCHKGTESHS